MALFGLVSLPERGSKATQKEKKTVRRRSTAPMASTSTAIAEAVSAAAEGGAAAVAAAPPPPPNAVPQKPASDVVAGAVARAASQSTIHPIDTLKVRLQTAAHDKGATKAVSSAVPPVKRVGGLKSTLSSGLSLYRGVVGAASGAGIAIGAYFAVYGVASNVIARQCPDLNVTSVAFLAGGVAAAGSSVVKVPLAVCIRSVQAGVYKNVFHAAKSITASAGPRGLFTGYLPTMLEDVPDMAFKFAAYESLRQLHKQLVGGRAASPHEDFLMGAAAGSFAAACTTPLDVVKTNMMCTAASRPTMTSAARDVLARGGPAAFFSGIGPRAVSNGINSAVFFCFFELLSSALKARAAAATEAKALRASAGPDRRFNAAETRRGGRGRAAVSAQPASLTMALHGFVGDSPIAG